MIIHELRAEDSAVTKLKIRFSANEILGEWGFDNRSNKNVDLAFGLQSIMLRFAEAELLKAGFNDLLFWRVLLVMSVLLN